MLFVLNIVLNVVSNVVLNAVSSVVFGFSYSDSPFDNRQSFPGARLCRFYEISEANCLSKNKTAVKLFILL